MLSPVLGTSLILLIIFIKLHEVEIELAVWFGEGSNYG